MAAGGDHARPPLRRVGRHTLIYGSGYAATAGVSLILVPIYTAHLSPAEFGLLALMLVLYGLGKQVYDLGFTNSVARFYFDGQDEDGRDDGIRAMQATGLTFLALYGGALTAALCVFAGAWSQLLTGTSSHADLVRIVALTLLADTIAIVPLTLIRMRERSGVFLTVTLIRLVTTLALGVWFVAVLDWGVRGALLATAAPSGAVLVVLLVADRVRNLAARVSWPLLRRMLAFGLPFFPVLVSGWVIDASDRYLLELYRPREEVGFYALAYRISQVMQIAVAAFIMGWAPLRDQIYRSPSAASVYARIASYYVIVASIVAVGIGLFDEEIVHVVAPASYAPAGEVVPLLVLAYVLQGLYFLMATGMGVSKKTTPMALVAATGAALNIGVNLLVIPRFGMQGAAVTTVGAYLIMVAGTCYASQRVYPIPYDWRRIAHVMALAIAVVAVVALVSPDDVAGGSACALAGWAAFVVLLVTTGAIHHSDMAAARRSLQSLRGRWARS